MSALRSAILSCMFVLGACTLKPNPLDPFDRIEVRVSAPGDGSGSVSANDAAVAISCQITNGASTGTGCNTRFPDAGGGGLFTLTAAELEDSEFVGWTGCASAVGTVCTLRFDAGVGGVTFTMTANFRTRGSAGVIGFDANLLQNASFEQTVAVGLLPTVVGSWQGDDAVSVEPPAGISVPLGSRVLQFRSTGPSAASVAGESGQQWQLIELSSLAADIDAGKVRATAKARFASVPGDAQTDRRFDLHDVARVRWALRRRNVAVSASPAVSGASHELPESA